MESIIRKEREKRGLSQARLSRLVGVSQQHIDRYEKGSPIPLDKVLILSDVLGINKYDLLPDAFKISATIKKINKIGVVQAGFWADAVQLPRDEWEQVDYVISDNLKNRRVFALGVRGNSMNLIFPPEITTLVCLDIADYCNLHPAGVQNGDFIIAQRINADGKYESTVKKYNKLDDGTVVLQAMSTDPRYTNIVVGADNSEYDIIAVVIDYQIKLKDF